MKSTTAGAVLKVVALTIDVGAPLAATLTQFPLWVKQSADATMSGLCLIFIVLSAIPFIKQLKEYFKSPSSYVVWGVIFVLFLLLRNILEQMLIVSFVGLISNLIGAGIYALGKNIAEKVNKK